MSVEEQSGKYKEEGLGTEIVCIVQVKHFIHLYTKLLAYYRKKFSRIFFMNSLPKGKL